MNRFPGRTDASPLTGPRLVVWHRALQQAEALALELRLPHVRLVDGMGGGGSVKTIEMSDRTCIPQVAGWDVVVGHLGVSPSMSLALGSVAGEAVFRPVV